MNNKTEEAKEYLSTKGYIEKSGIVEEWLTEFSNQQNKELIEELETERKLGLKLNSDYTDLNTRLSAELSQQKELVEKKDATIEGYKNNTAHLYDQISTLKQEIDGMKKERDKYYDLWFEGKYPKFSEQANNATTEPKEEKEDKCKCEKWQGINLSGNCYTCQKPI